MVTEAQKGLRNLWNLAGRSEAEKAKKTGGRGRPKEEKEKMPTG